ncbi:LacI family DNA-binding transcriptional regulator [Propionivibrio dicarboxylicus]|uniref:Transcriptional regulator, LacI family n=1 Tax=Propionivibrio dicarboxylicus TaxID=83767 RepID=A0A1G7XTE8_9RHOO|nr:LacI family DNA-binding transcriptional regulator [Propionivibrio dicarboxylicus]SDG87283.1 transcriptional regulator, LacI family [Propionivibrio dicarboxylicus]
MSTYTRLTIDDIARMAGVSRTTASMVLNGRAGQYRISAATQERVLATARDNNFQPSHSARTLRIGSSNTLGLVVPELTNFAHASLAQAMEPICHQVGYQLLVVTSNDDPEQEKAGIEHLIARQVDGLVIVPCAIESDVYRKWATRLPLFLVDRRLDDPALPYVVSDAEAAVTELVSDTLSSPDDEIYYFGGQPDFSPSIDRLKGFCAALARKGVAVQPEWIRARDYRRSSGYEFMRACYLELGRYPRFLFTGSITLLEGALAFISEHDHFDIAPKRLVTFDDHNLLDCLPLRVDSIEQDSNALAAASLERLLAMIGGDPVPASITIPAKLHRRIRDA